MVTPVARFAALPDATKSRYEDASSYYSIGWSHGKEKLEGKPDFSKGSYYANPLANRPVEDEELIKRCECPGAAPTRVRATAGH